jgi:pilus assembly protein CpaE
VVIADFDLPFGTAGLDFNQDPLQGLGEALASPERLDEVLLDRLLSLGPFELVCRAKHS